MSKVVGKVTRKIFESDNNYMVLLLKIKETDLDIDINKTITITGYFYDLETDLDFKTAVNLLLGDIASYLNKNNKDLKDTTLDKDKFYNLVNKVNSNELTSKNVKDIISDILERDISLEELIKEKNISNITDNTLILEIISNVIEENPDSVNDYKNGHDRAVKYLMGQVMKKSQGKADPRSAMELLNSELEKLK